MKNLLGSSFPKSDDFYYLKVTYHTYYLLINLKAGG